MLDSLPEPRVGVQPQEPELGHRLEACYLVTLIRWQCCLKTGGGWEAGVGDQQSGASNSPADRSTQAQHEATLTQKVAQLPLVKVFSSSAPS